MVNLGTVEDYEGRKFDLFLTSDIEGGPLDFIFSNKIISGIQKVVQIFFIKLFTSPNSKFVSSEGTDFNDSVTGANARTEYLRLFISLAVSQAFSQMRSEQDLDQVQLEDERITTAKVTSIDVTGDNARVVIFIETEAGQGIDVILPLETVLR